MASASCFLSADKVLLPNLNLALPEFIDLDQWMNINIIFPYIYSFTLAAMWTTCLCLTLRQQEVVSPLHLPVGGC